MPDDTMPDSEPDPRIEESLPQDFGTPHANLDKYGRFQVPKLNADYFLLEQAKSDFFLGLGMDEPRPIAWLWPEHIPIGKLTLIEGESKSGTSFLVADMAARVSRGSPWPGFIGPQLAGHVIVVLGGDNMHDTLGPRLINMQANLYNFTILSGITTHDPAEMRAGKADTDRRLCLPADLGHIEYQLRQRPDTRLLVVDSLSDFCQTDKQFREALRGLHEIAERCNVAVVATARPRNWRSARSKLQPSADRRSESVRCVLNVLVDPNDPSQRYLAPARMNFCREPKWVPFRIGEGIVEWGEPLEAAPVYKRTSEAAQEKVTVLKEAMDCLWDTLATCDMPAKVALKQVMECGFSKGTVVRARRELGVRSYREGWGPFGWWCWSLQKEGEAPGEEPEKGGNDEPGIGKKKPVRTGPPREKKPSPADEFGGVSFERMFRALFVESLNHNKAVEAAAAAQAAANGKPKPR